MSTVIFYVIGVFPKKKNIGGSLNDLVMEKQEMGVWEKDSKGNDVEVYRDYDRIRDGHLQLGTMWPCEYVEGDSEQGSPLDVAAPQAPQPNYTPADASSSARGSNVQGDTRVSEVRALPSVQIPLSPDDDGQVYYVRISFINVLSTLNTKFCIICWNSFISVNDLVDDTNTQKKKTARRGITEARVEKQSTPFRRQIVWESLW